MNEEVEVLVMEEMGSERAIYEQGGGLLQNSCEDEIHCKPNKET